MYNGIITLHCIAREYPREPALSDAHPQQLSILEGTCEPPVRGAMVLGLLDGTDTALNKTLEVEDFDKKKTMVPNPAYATWLAHDQHVLGWLVNSLSPEILAHVIDQDNTIVAWSTITSMFSSASKSKASHLRTALNNSKKKDMTADQYVTKMKGYVSELAAVEKIVDDDEFVGYILNGVDKTYSALVDHDQATPGISLDDLFGQL
jgi:hypothetical protein